MVDGVIGELIDQLGKLPGIGPKSAQRIALYVVQNPHYDPSTLADILATIRSTIRFCETCGMITSDNQCAICLDARRDESVICVVEEPLDVQAIERTREFTGLYHVLHGAISPVEGIGPENLKIGELLQRIRRSEPPMRELLLATNPNLEGEATAMYIARLTKPLGLRVTRLARGLPMGGDLEYADEVTLGRALAGRSEM